MRYLSLWGVFSILLVGFSVHAAPSGNCETSAARKTVHGAISRTECGSVETGGRSVSINIDGVPVLSSKELYKEDSNDELGYFIYSREADPATACSDRMFLIDTSTRPVKVFAFGVNGACNELSSVRWDHLDTMITLKKAVHFHYKHDTIIAPQSGSALWNAIEPPHAGKGLLERDAQPFVELVSGISSPTAARR